MNWKKLFFKTNKMLSLDLDVFLRLEKHMAGFKNYDVKPSKSRYRI